MEELLSIKKRIHRKEKDEFLSILERKLYDLGIKTEYQEFGKIIKSKNLETICNKPDYIFIAHYDTGTIMPFWFHPLMKLFGLNRQLLIMFLIGLSLPLISGLLKEHNLYIFYSIVSVFALSFLTVFIPNKNNTDDNTSGVLTLLRIAEKLKKEDFASIKLVFVDNEELGLWGSRAHKKFLKNQNAISENCKIISIDCVGGVGTIPLIIKNGKSDYCESVRSVIENEFGNCKSIRMELPLSDNYSFREYGAINISFVSESVLKKGYYLKDIHTKNDIKIDWNRIDKLSHVMVDLSKNN